MTNLSLSRILLSCISIVATTAIAAASPGKVSGWGTRGAFVFGGEVEVVSTDDVVGQFSILIDSPDGTHVSCRYYKFWQGNVTGGDASFYGLGYCHGPFGWFYSYNRFSITDAGSPGAGVDLIDVNYLGSSGVALPGGTIDSGDLAVGP